jgi:integrase/recombinase XerD
MDTYIDLYINSLEEEHRKSVNTLDAYRRDILEFHRYLRENGIYDVSEISNADIVSFMMKLRDDGRTGSTINRKMASLRSYTSFLCREGVLDTDPTAYVKPPKVEKKNLEYLTVEEVEAILAAPDDSIKGIRDRAILELMYGTGIRVTEVTELRMSDVNFRIGFITCSGEYGRARIIPLGKPCRLALEEYVEKSRSVLTESHNDDEEAAEQYVFVNYHGDKLTRQGLWKIVKNYAQKAGIEKQLTPQILRNSFAAHMIQNGADLKSIQELMGYEDLTTAQVFLSVAKNRIKEVYDRTHPRA